MIIHCKKLLKSSLTLTTLLLFSLSSHALTLKIQYSPAHSNQQWYALQADNVTGPVWVKLKQQRQEFAFSNSIKVLPLNKPRDYQNASADEIDFYFYSAGYHGGTYLCSGYLNKNNKITFINKIGCDATDNALTLDASGPL